MCAMYQLQDIIISGPSNITKHRTTHNEFVIRWTPIPGDVGDHFPVCFAVESAMGSGVTSFPGNTHSHSHSHFTPTSQSGVYQSEMRCVVVDVRREGVKTNVICTPSTMRVEVEKSSFRGLHEDHLRLSDPSNTVCSLETHSNSTHIIGVFPLNACGTQIEEDDENLIFKNEITTVDNRRDLITRKHLLEVEFYCQYRKKGNVTLGFSAHRKNVTVWDKGFGTFTYQFEFYPDNQFRTMIDPSSYPLEYDVGDKIYMEIDASSTVNNTELFVESCKASPYDNPNYYPTYTIIENGCPVDPTVMTHETNDNRRFRFCIQAFKFIGLHDQVYISCSVMVCEAGNPNSRCSQRCVNGTSSNSHQHSHRRKRSDTIQTATHFISQGPVRLKRSADIDTSAGASLNLNLVFITGCLLVVVGMICGVVMYKAKASRVKYQPLSPCKKVFTQANQSLEEVSVTVRLRKAGVITDGETITTDDSWLLRTEDSWKIRRKENPDLQGGSRGSTCAQPTSLWSIALGTAFLRGLNTNLRNDLVVHAVPSSLDGLIDQAVSLDNQYCKRTKEWRTSALHTPPPATGMGESNSSSEAMVLG
ncbi:ZP domain-containing protein-like [Pholidichthys leucotaenia]